MDTAPNALSLDVNEFVLTHWLARAPGPACACPSYISSPSRHSLGARLGSDRQDARKEPKAHRALSRSMEKQAPPSPSRSESFSRGGWLRSSKARVAPSLELERLDVDACLGESFGSSTASFIDMDPAELFSMRWTSDDSGLPLLEASEGDLLPCEPSGGIARVGDVDGGGVAYADVVSSSASSPVFHSAQSTPAPAPSGGLQRSSTGARPRTAPLLATRRLLLRYLRFLAPLCRKARSLAPRPGRALAATTTTTPARRSTSSVSSVAEHWCHGNADTAVRDAILYCKKSFTARAEC